MKKRVGLWIDHRQAIIVSVKNKKLTRIVIGSNVEKQPGRFNGIRSLTPFESQLVEADDSRQRDFTGKLNIYYDRIILSIRDAESILIFGPGEAKGELIKRLERVKLGNRIIGKETIARITLPQIMAKVREFFKSYKYKTS